MEKGTKKMTGEFDDPKYTRLRPDGRKNFYLFKHILPDLIILGKGRLRSCCSMIFKFY